jgi:hypothetical protein
MRIRYVTLTWDQRPREFEQDKCDIAYLIWKESDQREDSSIATIRMIANELQDKHEFYSEESIRYAIAVVRCGYNPVTTLTSGIRINGEYQRV